MSDSEENGARVLTEKERTVAADSIPLPPVELYEELDNSAGPSTDTPADAGATKAPKKEVADLDYVDGGPERRVSIRNSFRHDGAIVSEVRVLALTPADLAEILTKVENADVYDFYAAMTGLPASVIRGMRGRDGEDVTEACYDFLPRFMRAGD